MQKWPWNVVGWISQSISDGGRDSRVRLDFQRRFLPAASAVSALGLRHRATMKMRLGWSRREAVLITLLRPRRKTPACYSRHHIAG